MELKQCYQFDPRGYLVGVSSDQGGFLPANATYIEPPKQDGYIPRWHGTGWELVEDHRGVEFWLPGDTWATEPRMMDSPGPLPVGAVPTRPAKPADLQAAEAREAKMREINAGFEQMAATLVASYPQSELLTFDQQVAEAQMYIADQTAECPMLAPLAAARGIDMVDLCQRVLRKHALFSGATGNLMGQRQKMEDRLNAASTVAEIDAITVTYLLPGGGDV